MADGRHFEFRFLAIISASINIFGPKFVRRWKIGSPRGPIAQKSGFQKSKVADGRHLEFRFLAIISASINIFAPNLVPRWKSNCLVRPIGQKSGFRIGLSKMADSFNLDFRFWAIIWTLIKIFGIVMDNQHFQQTIGRHMAQ